MYLNPLNAKLNPICYLLALLGAHHFLHVSRIRVKEIEREEVDWICVVEDRELGSSLFGDCEQDPGTFISLRTIKAHTYMVEWKYKSIRS